MTKTLAELKRSIKKDSTITLYEVQESIATPEGRKLQSVFLDGFSISPRRLGNWSSIVGIPRTVTHIDSTGFYLKLPSDETKSRGSHCGWPAAARLNYAGNDFTITELDEYGEVWQVRSYRIIN